MQRDPEELYKNILLALADAAPLLHMDGLQELMVNPDGRVWIERHGHPMECTDVTLLAPTRRNVVLFMADVADQICDEDNPSVSGRLPVLHARFEGLIEPAVEAPSFSIRMPSSYVLCLQDYVRQGVLSAQQARAISKAVGLRQNILIAGSTGSGKTTFANAILDLIANTNHRVLTIEDTPELQNKAPNAIALFVHRQRGFDYQQALFSALRLRPDRIVVGELRDGAAALQLLKAWNTGHNGGLATLHANNATSSLPRLESLLQEVVAQTPRALIGEAIDLVIYIERYADEQGNRSRRVREIARVYHANDTGYATESLYHPSCSAQGHTTRRTTR